MVPLSLVVVGCKVHKVWRITEAIGFADVCGSVSADVLFLTLWSTAWTYALNVGRRHWTLYLVFQASVVVLFMVTMIDHVYFLNTGMVLDAGVVEFSLVAIDVHKAVVADQLTAPVVSILLSPLLLVVLTHLPPARAFASRLVGGRGRRRAPQMLVGVALCLLSSVAMASLGATEQVRFLDSNALVVFFRGVGKAIFGAEETYADVELPPPIRLVATANTKRHNVVLITLESSRRSAFGAYNSERETTPFFDRLARRGALVDDAYAVVPHTSKALVAIHCGVYPKLVPPIEEATIGLPSRCLADLLRERGYATAAFQSSEETFEHNHLLYRRFGFTDFAGKESLPKGDFDKSSYFGYEDKIMLEPVLRWVDKQRTPFFVTISTLVGHHNYEIPKGFETRTHDPDETKNRYLNTISYIDGFVRELHEGFAARQLLDDTLFVLVGDHGEGFGEHDRYQHDAVIYEEGLRVPLLFVGAGIDSAGATIMGLRQQPDILPTVLDVLGYEFSGGALVGRSVFASEGHQQLFFSCFHRERCQALRSGSYKYIDHFNRRGAEVFDLASDPLELTNLAGRDDPSHPLTEEDATQRQRRWRSSVNGLYQTAAKAQRAEVLLDERPAIGYPVDVHVDDYLTVLGYDAPRMTLPVREQPSMTFYYEVRAKPENEWVVFIKLRSPAGDTFRVDQIRGARFHLTDQWRAGQIMRDEVPMMIPSNTAPGRYEVLIGTANQRDVDDTAGSVVATLTLTAAAAP